MGASALPKDDQTTLTAVNQVFSTFSVCGSAFIITSYLLFPNLRKFSYKLVLWLTISDMFNQSMSFLGNPNQDQIPCHLQAAGMQFFSVASFLWTGAIAYVLRSTVIDKRSDIESKYRRMHAIVWSSGAVAAIVPAWKYGPTGAWCWIYGDDLAGKIMRFLFYYAPLWVCIGYNSFAYISVIRFLRRVQLLANSISSQEAQPRIEMKAISRLGYYPSILIVTHIWGTVNRIQNWAKPHDPVFWLFFLHTIASSSMGLLNCAAYGLNGTVRANWCEKFPFLTKLAFWGGRAREAQKFHKFENEMGQMGGIGSDFEDDQGSDKASSKKSVEPAQSDSKL